MDPLSIIASSIAMAQVVHGSLETFTKLRRATPEFIAVHNEIVDLLVLLNELEETLKPQAGAGVQLPPTTELFQSLVRLTQKLEQLSKHVASWIKLPSAGSPNKAVPPWKRMGAAHYANRYKDELRGLRMALSNYLTITGLLSTARIQIDLKQILLCAEQADGRGKEIVNLLQQRSVAEHGLPTPSVDSSTQTAQSAFRYDLDSSSLNISQVLFDTKQLTAISAVGIRTAQFPRAPCTPWCSCVCHSERRIGTPKALEWVLGSLFVGYSGMPILSQKCNQQSCHLRAQPTSYITYYFPPWFLSRMVSVLFTVTPMAGPVVSLKTQRTVPSSADVLTYAKSGDVKKIQLLFEQGQASPHDVDYDSGVTALHLAISHKRIDVCRYLLKMNADPFLEDRTQWAAADNAWDKILSGTFPKEAENALRLLFSETECIERREFSVVHKIVLGLTSIDLATYLSASTLDINASDSNGRTALSLAAERGSIEALKTLLQYGPSVDLPNRSGATPLHFAACAKDPSVLEILLNADAAVDSLTDWNQTPLIYAAAYTKDAQHAQILLDAGAKIDFRDLDGITALSWTAIADNLPVATVLIQRQADVQNVDNNGDTVMTLCVSMNRVDFLKLLQESTILTCSDLDVPSKAKNILQIAAETASLGILEALIQFTWNNPDNCTDERESSWKQAMEQRVDYNEQLADAFEALLLKARGPKSTGLAANADGDAEDEYVEAVEYIN